MKAAKALEHGMYVFRYRTTRKIKNLPVEYYHTHQGIEILYVYEGNGHVILNDQFYVVHPRTLIIFKPFQLHYIRMEAATEYTCSLIKVKPIFMEQCESLFPYCYDMISGYLNDDENQQVFRLNESQHRQLDESCRHLHHSLRPNFKYMHDEVVFLFLIRFFVDLVIHIIPSEQARTPTPFRTTQPVNELLQWIDAHYKEQHTLDRIAEALHISVHHMSKLFRKQTGQSIRGYINEKRLEQSRILLHTFALSVEEISKQVGFNSSSYFIRLFKRKYGITPHQYRLNVKKMYTHSQE